MIVKVPPKRRDGSTSFEKLKDYMTEGLTNLGADTSMVSFENLTQYITTETALNAMGDKVEKTIAVEIGNLTSLTTAPAEMWAVSQQNKRCTDPVYHYILSWPEHERPPAADIMAAARHTLTALGLQEHQYIIAVHANTDNLHAHIEVNRIHPQTYRSRHLEWAHKTLHKAAREMEVQYGWSHDNGLWQVMEVDGKKLIVPNNTYIDQDVAPLSTKARDFEVWNGRESFESWCKREPADALRVALEKGPTSWQEIHRALSAFGIELKDSGGGGLKVELSLQGDDGKTVAAAASKAFRFLKRKELEKSIGPFVPLDRDAPIPVDVKSYKRDPVKRMVRKAERQAQRDALFAQFSEENEIIVAKRDKVKSSLKHSAKAAKEERYQLLKKSYLAKRDEIKNDKAMTGKQKQQAYTLLKMTYEQAKEELKEQIASERKMISELTPKVKSWRTWVEEQAEQGNEAAVSALRGMVYEEKRKTKREGKGEDEEEDPMPSIRPAPARPDEAPTIKPLSALTWRVSSNGRVFYQFKKTNELAFIDEGQRLTFGRPGVTDEALLATLRYAKMKWGPTLHVSGGDGIFRERLVRLASTLDMTVDNQELQSLQQQLQTSKARTAPALPAAESRRPDPVAIPMVEDLVRGNPDAKVIHAATQDKTYRGRIENVTETHALQLIGSDRYVLHDIRTLDTAPAVGADLAIRYRSGSGKVTENTRSKGR